MPLALRIAVIALALAHAAAASLPCAPHVDAPEAAHTAQASGHAPHSAHAHADGHAHAHLAAGAGHAPEGPPNATRFDAECPCGCGGGAPPSAPAQVLASALLPQPDAPEPLRGASQPLVFEARTPREHSRLLDPVPI